MLWDINLLNHADGAEIDHSYVEMAGNYEPAPFNPGKVTMAADSYRSTIENRAIAVIKARSMVYPVEFDGIW